jgi:hypothetical protein
MLTLETLSRPGVPEGECITHMQEGRALLLLLLLLTTHRAMLLQLILPGHQQAANTLAAEASSHQQARLGRSCLLKHMLVELAGGDCKSIDGGLCTSSGQRTRGRGVGKFAVGCLQQWRHVKDRTGQDTCGTHACQIVCVCIICCGGSNMTEA